MHNPSIINFKKAEENKILASETDEDIIYISNLEISFTKNIKTIISNHYTICVEEYQSIMKNISLISIPNNLKDRYDCVMNGYSFMIEICADHA